MADILRAVIVDGLTIQTTDQGAQVIERLQKHISDVASAVAGKDGQLAALMDANTRALAAKDGEIAALTATHAAVIATKDGEIAALSKSIPDAVAMDAAIEARTSVVGIAKATLGDSFDPKGKSIADIQKAVVTHRLGDAAVANRPAEFFAGAFDTLALADAASGASNDPLRAVLAAGVTLVANDRKKVPSYEERMALRWKGKK